MANEFRFLATMGCEAGCLLQVYASLVTLYSFLFTLPNPANDPVRFPLDELFHERLGLV